MLLELFNFGRGTSSNAWDTNLKPGQRSAASNLIIEIQYSSCVENILFWQEFCILAIALLEKLIKLRNLGALVENFSLV